MNSPSLPIKRIKIGIIGLNFGRQIVEQLHAGCAAKYFELVAVCDLDATKAEDFGRRYGVRAYATMEQLLADPRVEVVGLFTGPGGRAKLLRQIIRAGKNVITTKPFELDPVAAREVLEEAQSLGRLILLNSPSPEPCRWVQKCLDWRDQYDLGTPVACRAEVVVSYREQADGSWYDDPARCPAPPLFRLGIYLINDIYRLLGEVEKVQVLSSRLFTGRPTADSAQLSMLFKNRALGSIFASFCVDDGQYYAYSYVLHYERGTIYKNIKPTAFGKANLSARMSSIAKRGDRELATDTFNVDELDGDYQWDVFHRAFTAGEPPVSMPIEGIVHGISVIKAMALAEQSGRLETV